MKRFTFLFSALLVAGLMLSACGGAAAGPLTVQSVALSNAEGGTAATTFSPADHTIYAAVQLSRIDTGLTVKLTWSAVDSAGQSTEIVSKEFSALAANTITGNISAQQDWPTGSYKLDVYLNGAIANTTTFTIQ